MKIFPYILGVTALMGVLASTSAFPRNGLSANGSSRDGLSTNGSSRDGLATNGRSTDGLLIVKI